MQIPCIGRAVHTAAADALESYSIHGRRGTRCIYTAGDALYIQLYTAGDALYIGCSQP